MSLGFLDVDVRRSVELSLVVLAIRAYGRLNVVVRAAYLGASRLMLCLGRLKIRRLKCSTLQLLLLMIRSASGRCLRVTAVSLLSVNTGLLLLYIVRAVTLIVVGLTVVGSVQLSAF